MRTFPVVLHHLTPNQSHGKSLSLTCLTDGVGHSSRLVGRKSAEKHEPREDRICNGHEAVIANPYPRIVSADVKAVPLRRHVCRQRHAVCYRNLFICSSVRPANGSSLSSKFSSSYRFPSGMSEQSTLICSNANVDLSNSNVVFCR